MKKLILMTAFGVLSFPCFAQDCSNLDNWHNTQRVMLYKKTQEQLDIIKTSNDQINILVAKKELSELKEETSIVRSKYLAELSKCKY